MINLLPKIFPRQSDDQRQARITRDLIRQEAEFGRDLFGAVPAGHRRDFFCLDEHTWIWHEEWKDKQGKDQVLTTRYDIRPSGILKSQNGQGYQQLGRDEAYNLYKAATLYRQRACDEYQRILQNA